MVLGEFGQAETSHRQVATGDLCKEGINRPLIWEGVHAQVLLRGEDVVEKMQHRVKGRGDRRCAT